MNTIWRNLLWREWHEYKWKLAALSAILLTVQVYLGFESGNADVPPIAFWFLCLIPGAFFVGVRTATGERTSRTLEFTRALPIKTWQTAAVKLGMAAITCLLPIVFSILVALGFHFWRTSDSAGPTTDTVSVNARELQGAMVLGLLAAGTAISVLIWATAAAVGQPSELRASAAAAAAMLGWPAALLVTAIAAQRLFHISTGDLSEFALATGPCGFLVVIFGANFDFTPRHQLLDVVLQLSSLIAVTAWTLRRFGRLNREAIRSPGAAAAPAAGSGTYAIARTNWRPLTALAWKQWRE
ncbi:MAG TPA: hypothetical protein VHB99_03830, partial [Pirellulales bacterium]|nr:hypothetical protein [Pirellulales bacterium]